MNEHCPHGDLWYACTKCMDELRVWEYPTTHAFNLIEKWDFHHTDKLFEFIRNLWWSQKYLWSQKDDGEKITYDISTGGWSGNESLVMALRENHVIWMFTWVQSRRGGHYIFELPYKKQPFMKGKKESEP